MLALYPSGFLANRRTAIIWSLWFRTEIRVAVCGGKIEFGRGLAVGRKPRPNRTRERKFMEIGDDTLRAITEMMREIMD